MCRIKDFKKSLNQKNPLIQVQTMALPPARAFRYPFIWRKSCVAGMRMDDLCLSGLIPIKINYIYIKV